MLTSTDVHLLVGLLGKAYSPESVSLVLGAPVVDKASGTRRDLDVWVDGWKGTRGIVMGIEVKAEKRPVDIILVEQLCAKFGDLQGVDEGIIVSASGYTGSCMRKANYHGVRLWTLRDWEPDRDTPADLMGAFLGPQILEGSGWLTGPRFVLNHQMAVDEMVKREISFDSMVTLGRPEGKQDRVRLASLLDEAARQVRGHAVQKASVEALQGAASVEVSQVWVFEGAPVVDLPSGPLHVEDVHVSGTFSLGKRKSGMACKSLVDEEDGTPIVSFAVGEVSSGQLVGFSIRSESRRLEAFSVPVSDRNRAKIKDMRLW